jgi:hypothetical protein
MSEETDPPVQDPPTPAEPAPPAAPAPGPWADQLAQQFQDEAVRGQVDAFLRGNVQPYVTQLEQSRNKDAEELYTQLSESPGETYLAITEELWGEEAANAVRESLIALNSDEPPPDPQANPATPPEPTPDLDPRVARLVEKEEEAERAREYQEALTAFKGKSEEHGKINDRWFAPFVVSADGDLPTAYEGYKQWLTDVEAKYAPPPPTEEGAPAAEPPPVIGSDTTATTAPPTVKQGQSLDEAITDFLDEQRASKAPTAVGTS